MRIVTNKKRTSILINRSLCQAGVNLTCIYIIFFALRLRLYLFVETPEKKSFFFFSYLISIEPSRETKLKVMKEKKINDLSEVIVSVYVCRMVTEIRFGQFFSSVRFKIIFKKIQMRKLFPPFMC